ncbi:MAG: glycine cleavage system protein H, partial [Chloroflexi bacterium]|nr:glycine cleavage system protein H [Chloroflexota bacterium]
GDVVFLDLPQVGARLAQFQKLGEVESVKAVSDVFSPVAGQVAEVNSQLLDHPELVNEDPYVKGWMVRLGSVNQGELANLMTAEQYEEYLSKLE